MHVDAVHNGLPLIDTQRTVIDKFCPAYLKRPKCTIKRYREYNGMCNNLDHPHWGATLAPYRRLLPADYADGKHHWNTNEFLETLETIESEVPVPYKDMAEIATTFVFI